jgi:chromosome partitioning protein
MEIPFLRIPQLAMISGLKRHTLNARAKSSLKRNLRRNPGNQILLEPPQVRTLIEDRLTNQSGKVIYVGNLKGGVGKTTISYLLSNTTAALGLKTCVVDLDVQSNLTQQYINIDTSQSVFYDVIDNKKDISKVIIPVSNTLHIIPSSLKNSLIQKALSMQAPKHHLSWFNDICLNYLRKNYDVIIVDTPPHLTTLNSVFCLCLVDNDHIAIPVCAEDFSMMGVQMFLDDILDIRRSYEICANTKVSIIMNRFFQSQKNNLEMLVKMSNSYGDMLSEIIIRDNAKVREVINNKISISDIKKGKEIYEVMSMLLLEFNILRRVEN